MAAVLGNKRHLLVQLENTFDYPNTNYYWRAVVNDQNALKHARDDGLGLQALALGLVPSLYEKLILIVQVIDDLGFNDSNLEFFG